MPTSPPRKSISLIFNTLPRCTMRRIHAPNGGNNAFLPAFGAHLALTFDLDDTLYDNRPVILRTRQKVGAYLCAKFSSRLAQLPMKSATPAPGGTGSGTRDLSRRDALAFSFD